LEVSVKIYFPRLFVLRLPRWVPSLILLQLNQPGIVQMLRTLRMDPATVAEIAGNSTKTIYEHYDINVSIDEQNHARDQMDMLARGKFKEARI